MARKKRSAGLARQAAQFAHSEMPDDVPWQTQEKLRAWCPCCGMVADAERFEQAPHQPDGAIERFGGKLPDGRGYIKYFEIFPEEREQILRLELHAVEEARKLLLEMLGLPEGPDEEEFLGGYVPAPGIQRQIQSRPAPPDEDLELPEHIPAPSRRRSVTEPKPTPIKHNRLRARPTATALPQPRPVRESLPKPEREQARVRNKPTLTQIERTPEPPALPTSNKQQRLPGRTNQRQLTPPKKGR